MGIRTLLPFASRAWAVSEERLRAAPRKPSQLSIVVLLAIVLLTSAGAFKAVRGRFTPATPRIVPASVTIDTRPTGVDLFADGQRMGTTPLTLSVAPGPHTFTVRTGASERMIRIDAASGAQVTHYLELRPDAPVAMSPGRLSVITDPPGARVAIDGRERGVTPLVVDEAAVGQHEVLVASDTGSATRRVTVDPGVTKEVVFALPRSAAPVGGWVLVTSGVPVDLVEHAEVVGTSGTGAPTRIMLPAGRHDLVLRNDELAFQVQRRIEIIPGRVTSVDVVAPKGSLNINARPWAEVSIDGASLGQTPLAGVSLSLGRHEVTFRHPQFGERRQTVVVTATGPNRLSVDLTK